MNYLDLILKGLGWLTLFAIWAICWAASAYANYRAGELKADIPGWVMVTEFLAIIGPLLLGFYLGRM